MKKNNAFGIIILIAFTLASGYLLGTVLGWVFGQTGFNIFNFLSAYTFMLFFTNYVNLIVYPIAKSTMNKNIKKHNFGKTTTFVSNARFAFKSILCIDEDTGRVGYVSLSDPFRFQMANPGELSKIRSTVSAFAQGGKRFVFFEFYYGENKMRFPTYRVRNYGFVTERRVQEALETGNSICNLLLRFNPGGDDFSINKDIPFSKTALCGFIFSFISVYVTVAALLALQYAENVPAVKFFPTYILALIAAIIAIAGLVLGIKVLKGASVSPVRGKGFAKTSVIMSSIILVILILIVWLLIEYLKG